MSDRANRVLWTLVALVLVIGGGGGLAFSFGALGPSAAHADVITSHLVRQWHRGGTISFAVASAIGLVLVVAGLSLAAAELARDTGRSRLEDFTVTGRSAAGTPPADGARGFTLVRASCLGRALETDLARIDGVQGALVRLFGKPGRLDLRARLDVADDASLSSLATLARACLDRLEATSGLRPRAVDMTVTLVASNRPRVG